MFRYTITCLLFLFIVSCKQNKKAPSATNSADNTKVDSLAIINDAKNYLNIQTNNFSEIDSSGVFMFPLSMSESKREAASLSYKEMPGNSYWNIIFLNSKTNEYHLLADKKMLINSYEAKYYSNDTIAIAALSQYIFYIITTDDYNKDKLLNNEDPKYLFVSDKEGNNFRQLSPANYDLENWQYVKSLNKVIFTLKRDTDANNIFDNKDEVTAFEYDLNKDTAATALFSPDFKNKLKIQFDRDWKRVKK